MNKLRQTLFLVYHNLINVLLELAIFNLIKSPATFYFLFI